MALDPEQEDVTEQPVPGSSPEDYVPPETPEETYDPATDYAAPRPPRLSEAPGSAMSNLNQIAAYGDAVARFNARTAAANAKKQAAQQKRQHNEEARVVSAQTGARFYTDASGVAQPLVDPDTGKQKFSPRTTPVRYGKDGTPYQISTDETGARTIEDPDKNAEYGENPDDPNDPYIYRKTKATPWQPVDPEEGIHSQDGKLAAASAKALHKREIKSAIQQRRDLGLGIQQLRSSLNPEEADPSTAAETADDTGENLIPHAIPTGGLTQKARALHEGIVQSNSTPIPQPSPKAGLFGVGVNQQATADAMTQWEAKEKQRQAALAASQKILAVDDQIKEGRSKMFDLSMKVNELRKEGPMGILKRRRDEAAKQLANLPSDQVETAVADKSAQIQAADADISSRSQALKDRSDSLAQEEKLGVTAARAEEILGERARILAESRKLQESISRRNAVAEETNAGIASVIARQAEEKKAQRDKMRADPTTAPFADQLDAIDAEEKTRSEAIQSMPDGPGKEAAAQTLADEMQKKRQEPQSELKKVQYPKFAQQENELRAYASSLPDGDPEKSKAQAQLDEIEASVGKDPDYQSARASEAKFQDAVKRVADIEDGARQFFQDIRWGRDGRFLTDNSQEAKDWGTRMANAETDAIASLDTPEQIDRFRQAVKNYRVQRTFAENSKPKGFWDKINEIKDNPAQLLPFIASAPEIAAIGDVSEAVKKIQAGTAVNDDFVTAATFAGQNQAKKDMWYNVAEVLAMLPSFAGELVTTGGAYTAGKEAAVKGAVKGLEALTAKGAAKWVEKMAVAELGEQGAKELLGQLAVKSAASMAGSAAQLPVASFGRITSEYASRTMPQIQEMVRNDKGSLDFLIKDGEKPLQAGINSIANQYVEVFSEHSGAAFDILGKAVGKAIPTGLRNKIGKAFIFGKWMEKNPGAKPSQFGKMLKEAGWNGVFQEMGEERIGDLARGFTEFAQRLAGGEGFVKAAKSAYDNNAPDSEQLLTELISFSVPGAAISGANYTVGKVLGAENLNKPTSPTPILPEQAAAAQAEIAASPMPERVPAMAAALKLVTGTPFDALTKAEQDAVKPHVAKVKGQIVVTDDILSEMSQASPAVASLMDQGSIRDEAARRLEILQKGGVENGKTQNDAQEGQGRQTEVLTPQGAPAGPTSGGASPLSHENQKAPQQQGPAADQAGIDQKAGGQNSPEAQSPAGEVGVSRGTPPLPVGKFGAITPQSEAIHAKIISDLESAPKEEGSPHYSDLTPEQKQQASDVIRNKIAPQIAIYGNAVKEISGQMEYEGTKNLRQQIASIKSRISSEKNPNTLAALHKSLIAKESELENKRSGGMSAGEDTIHFNILDLLHPDELKSLNREKTVEKVVEEEVTHLCSDTAAHEQYVRETRDTTKTKREAASIMYGQVWDSLPKNLQRIVLGIREMKESNAARGAEFLRMQVQKELSVDGAGRLLNKNGAILSEEVIGAKCQSRVKKFIAHFLRVAQNLRNHLRTSLSAEGVHTPEEIEKSIGRIENIVGRTTELVRNSKKTADEHGSRAYGDQYGRLPVPVENRLPQEGTPPHSHGRGDQGNPQGRAVDQTTGGTGETDSGVQPGEMDSLADPSAQNPTGGTPETLPVEPPATSETGYQFEVTYQPRGSDETVTETVRLASKTLPEAREEQKKALLSIISKGTIKGRQSKLEAATEQPAPEAPAPNPAPETAIERQNGTPEQKTPTTAKSHKSPTPKINPDIMPILSWLDENGGVKGKNKSGNAAGNAEQEQSGGIKKYGNFAKTIYGDAHTADEAAHLLAPIIRRTLGIGGETTVTADNFWEALDAEIAGARKTTARENALGKDEQLAASYAQEFKNATAKSPGKVLANTADMQLGQILDAGPAGHFLVDHITENGDVVLVPEDAPEDGLRSQIVEAGTSLYLSSPIADSMDAPFSISEEHTGGIGIPTVQRAVESTAKRLGLENLLPRVRVVGNITDKPDSANASNANPDDIDFARHASLELAKHDEIFRYPITTAHSLEEVFADVFPDAKYLGEDTRPDEREESQADRRFVFQLSGKNFYVFERGRDVWIDVSRLEEGDRGSGVYAAVGNYAHNTRREFVGDPNGVSEAAVIRRTSAMLSLALRFGSTNFLQASPEQIAGNPEKGIAPLDWSGNSSQQTNALLKSFLGTLSNRLPGIQNYRFDFDSGLFLDPRGRPIGSDRLRDAGELDLPRAARAGEATLRRGIFLQSLVESQSGQRPELLEKLLSGRSALLNPAGLSKIFSRRNSSGQIEGYYDPRKGEIVLNASAISSAKRAGEVFLHEAVGHGGMSAALRGINPKGYENLAKLLQNFKREDGSSLWTDVQARYPSAKPETLFDEALARLAENPNRSAREESLFKRIVDAIRNWLTKRGLANWTPADVDALIRRSADAARQGFEKQEKELRYARLKENRDQLGFNFDTPTVESRASYEATVPTIDKNGEGNLLAPENTPFNLMGETLPENREEQPGNYERDFYERMLKVQKEGNPAEKAEATRAIARLERLYPSLNPQMELPANPGWEKFPAESGTLGIPREEMPQVPADARGALVNFLKARGIEITNETTPAQSLKPSQSEFNPAKVTKAVEMLEGTQRKLLVSSDGYLLDGHHQWMASKGRDVEVARLSIPAKEALSILSEFPSTEGGEMASQLALDPNQTISNQKEIQDFGAKLGGARKDRSASIAKEFTDDDIAGKTLSEIWPKAEVDAIEDTQLAAVAHAVRSEVPAKPRNRYKLSRWVETVKLVRGLMRHAEEKGFDEIMRLMEEKRLEQFTSKIRLLSAIPREAWDRVGEVRDYPNAYRYVDGPDGRTKYENGKAVTEPTPFAMAEVDGGRIRATNLTELAEKVAATTAEGKTSPKMEFQVRGRPGSYFINKKGDPLYRHLKEFTDSKEALDFARNHHGELVKAWDAVKESDNVKERDLRRNDNRPRTGSDRRHGRDVTPEMFQNAFGFRGVEFGNWVSQGENSKERQGMLNQAFDALHDLADIIGIPPRAVSLNGELGLGFGSRGKGGFAAAHYEPGTIVINLTKTKGAGTLAHEWFHALDHYFQRQRNPRGIVGREGDYITKNPEVYFEGPTGQRLSESRYKELIARPYNADRLRDWKRIEGVRPEVAEAFSNLVKALDASPMAKRAALIDKGKSDGYWSKIIERAARAFENFTIFKMAQQGYHNDYLANVVAPEEFARDAGRYPYLLDSEMKPVADAFDNLFSTIETVETEKGMRLQESVDAFKPGTYEALDGMLDREDLKSLPQRLNDEQINFDEYLTPQTDPKEGSENRTTDIRPEGIQRPAGTPGNPDGKRTGAIPGDGILRTDTTPDATPAQSQAVSHPESHAKWKILGNAITFIKKAGTGALLGKNISRPEDVAVLSQVYRDPRFETLRVYYVNDAGTIIHETAVSSRLANTANLLPGQWQPGEIQRFVDDTKATMGKVGATGFYMVHNHPSGDPTPSGLTGHDGDVPLTKKIIELSGDAFKAHVIINSGKYSSIIRHAGTGVSLNLNSALPNPEKSDSLLTPSVPHQALGKNVSDPSDVARLAKEIEKSKNVLTFIGGNVKAKATGIMSVDRSLLDNPHRLVGMISYFARNTGSYAVFLGNLSPLEIQENHSMLANAIRHGFLFNAIATDGTNVRQEMLRLGWNEKTIRQLGRKLSAKSFYENPEKYHQEQFAFDTLPEDKPAAQADGARYPIERFNAELPQAIRIAGAYGNIPGVDGKEVQQTARLALADAARKFDPALGKAFSAYAGVAVRNRLRSLYRKEDIRRERFPVSLDEPVGADSSGLPSTRGDFAPDTRTPLAPENASRDEATRMLEKAISELPEKMQIAVRGFTENKTFEEIGREMGGVTKQRAEQVFQAAMRRLRGKLGEQGVNATGAILSKPNRGEIPEPDYGEETIDQRIDHLMAELESEGKMDMREIGDLQNAALAEEASGAKKKIGRPDLAFGTKDPYIRGIDQYYTDTTTPEQHEQWEKDGDAMLAKDREGTRKKIELAGLSGETLNPEETKAALTLSDQLLNEAVKDGSEKAWNAFSRFWMAYRMTGRESARALGARVDRYMSKAMRHREMLTNVIFSPRNKAQKKINAAPSEAQKDAQIADLQRKLDDAISRADAAERAAVQKQIIETKKIQTKEYLIDEETKALIDKLKAAGIEPQDILKDKYSLTPILKNIKAAALDAILSKGDKDTRRQAFEMILKNRGFAEIAQKTGLPEAEVRQIKADFISKIRENEFAKFQGGMKADERENGKIAVGTKPVDNATAEREFQKFLAKFGIVDDAVQGKPKFDIEDPAHVMRVTREILAARNENKWVDMAYEAWIMNILSGPQTHVANITGNFGMAMLNLTLQRGMEAAINSVIRDSKSASFGEFKYLIKGILPGFAKGYAMGAKTWSAEKDFFEHTYAGTPNELGQWDKLGGTQSAIPGKIGRTIRIPGRALLFSDAMFKAALFQMEVGAHAYRIAKAMGLKGDALARKIELLSKTKGEIISDNYADSKPSQELVEFIARQLNRRNPDLSIDDLVADHSSDAWEMAREQVAYEKAKSIGWDETAVQRAVQSARENSFQQDLLTTKDGGNHFEDAAAKLQNARFGNKLIGYFFPFVKTPYNIFRLGIRKSPLGSFNLAFQAAKGLYSMKEGKPYLEGHPELVRDLAEQAVAWGAGALLLSAFAGDPDDDKKLLLITGSPDKNHNVADLESKAFGGPYTIRFGGRNGFTLPYGRLEPIATILGVTADTARAIKRNGSTEDNLRAFWGFVSGQFSNKTFLQGLQNISDLWNGRRNPGAIATKAALQFFVPNLIRSPLRNLDDTVRENKTAGAAYTLFPSGSNAEPKINQFDGSEVKKDWNPLARIFMSPAIATDPTLNKTQELLIAWNRANPAEAWAPSEPANTFKDLHGKNHDMTAEETTKFRRLTGQRAAALLRGVVNSRNAAHPTESDLKAVQNAFRDAASEIKERMFNPGYILRREK